MASLLTSLAAASPPVSISEMLSLQLMTISLQWQVPVLGSTAAQCPMTEELTLETSLLKVRTSWNLYLDVIFVFIFVSTAPSGAPAIVSISSVGNNSVEVSWTPSPGVVRGYRVFYSSNSSVTSTLTVSNVTTAVVHGLTLGVQYQFTVQTFADFPSQNSSADTVMLIGEAELMQHVSLHIVAYVSRV